MNLSGKVALVAGGLGSLGEVVVQSLQEGGAAVSVVDVRAPKRHEPPGVLALQADLSDDEAVAGAVSEVATKLGNISLLVNCAGLIHSEPLVSLTNPVQRRHRLSTWENTIRSNLTATFLLTAHVAEHMVATRTRGLIISFSSVAARGNPGQTAYSAAKAGVEAMTKVWARELGPLGIRAVAIAPGFVDTPSTERALNDAMIAEVKKRTPLLRLAKPREIAAAIAFAVENDFVTGATIAVDGGLVL